MSRAAESIVVCEGYHDRAFLRGWLVACRCEDAKDRIYPPINKVLKGGGQFGFRTPAGRWLRIVPAGGDGKLLEKAQVFVTESRTRAIERIVVVWDRDDEAGAEVTDPRRASFEAWARGLGAKQNDGCADWLLTGQAPPGQPSPTTSLSLIVWSALDPSDPELPGKQTLERLACAAVREAYPGRCRAVRDWLEARPGPPTGEKVHKTHAASHMAGWFSERGYEGFFDAVWEDERIRAALLKRLDEVGAGGVLDAMLG